MSRPLRPVAMVTGASAGIGLATSVDLARHGYDLVVTARSNARLTEVIRAVEAVGGSAHPFELDLTHPKVATEIFTQAWASVGGIDALVNNAGQMNRSSALDVTLTEWDDLFNANLRGAFFLSQAFANSAIESGRGGAIVNVSSSHGCAVLANRSVYGITKAGLNHLTRCLALEWAPLGIRVNAVVPATVATPSRLEVFGESASGMTARIPLGRFGAPEEIAATVRFLLSSEASFVTGACLPVDGGLTVQ